MKNYLNYITAALFLGLTVFASCGGEDDPDPVDPLIEKAEMLTGTASLSDGGVSKPNGATELDWSGLVVTITGDETGGSINAAGSADETVWPTSATWTFSNTTGTKILRSDGVEIDLITVSETSLVCGFSISQPAARAGVIEGDWQFSFDY
ncbi:MAG: hypothetical protein JXR07_06305 [Reichenbachiella sp.]